MQSLYEFWTAAVGKNPLEWVAVLSGFACVWLVARESLWNFPIAIVSCGLYIVVYLRAVLYFDTMIMMMFIALCVYVWYVDDM